MENDERESAFEVVAWNDTFGSVADGVANGDCGNLILMKPATGLTVTVTVVARFQAVAEPVLEALPRDILELIAGECE